MFLVVDDVLIAHELTKLNDIADRAEFVDGRHSNPHSTVKTNLQLHEQEASDRASQILVGALTRNEEVRRFCVPRFIAPPRISKYRTGMAYGLHHDAALMNLGQHAMRADVSCTIFLNDPESYKGGALHIKLGGIDVDVRLPAGSALLYRSDSLHEVRPVTSGERRVGVTWIQSRIANPDHREWLHELDEVAALEGSKIGAESLARLERVMANLLRQWTDAG